MLNYLEYRPQLEYKRELELKFEQEARSYIPSNSVVEALALTPTDVLTQLLEVKNYVEDKLTLWRKDILKNVPLVPVKNYNPFEEITEDEVPILANSLSLDDYIKARELNDVDIVNAFEEFHQDALNGNTKAEAFTLVLDAQEEIEALIDFMNQHYFDNRAHLDTLDRLREKEEANLLTLAKLDKEGKADTELIAEDNHILAFIADKSSLVGEMVERLDIVTNQTLNDEYHGAMADAVRTLIQNPSALPQMKKANRARFKKHATNSGDAKERIKRTCSPAFKLELLDELVKSQKEKLDNRALLTWVERESKENNPLNALWLDLLDGIEEMNAESEELIEDAYNLYPLEQIQYNDFIVSLQEKKMVRDLDQLFADIQEHIDFQDPNLEDQIEDFIKHFEIESVHYSVATFEDISDELYDQEFVEVEEEERPRVNPSLEYDGEMSDGSQDFLFTISDEAPSLDVNWEDEEDGLTDEEDGDLVEELEDGEF